MTANPLTMTEVLRQATHDCELRRETSRQARSIVEQVHDCRIVARALVHWYREALTAVSPTAVRANLADQITLGIAAASWAARAKARLLEARLKRSEKQPLAADPPVFASSAEVARLQRQVHRHSGKAKGAGFSPGRVQKDTDRAAERPRAWPSALLAANARARQLEDQIKIFRSREVRELPKLPTRRHTTTTLGLS
jgi:hypothetical protein